MVWHKKGEHDKAIEYFELALESDLKTYGENHPAVATDRNNLGSVWQVLNKLNKAIEYFELALESVNKNHPNVAIYRNDLAEAKKALANKAK
jgi:tetratricopeptide (TPR) repeat protein